MCANTYIIICSVSQTSCDHSGTPKWESELSYEGGGRGTAQPWPGRNSHRGRDENATELMKIKVLF